MEKGKQDEASNEKHPEERVFWIVGFGMATMALVPGVFAFFFRSLDWGGPTDWATFATYFSGVATPVVALCSALLFYRSIIVQRDEFKKTREEMEFASELQLDSELSRIKLTRQSQLERALPKARDLQKSLFNNLAAYELESYKYVRDKEIQNRFESYVSRSLSVVVMIIEYLSCGGDIYLVLNYIDEITSENKQLRALISESPLSESSEANNYFIALAELWHRRNKELKKYASKIEDIITKPQSA